MLVLLPLLIPGVSLLFLLHAGVTGHYVGDVPFPTCSTIFLIFASQTLLSTTREAREGILFTKHPPELGSSPLNNLDSVLLETLLSSFLSLLANFEPGVWGTNITDLTSRCSVLFLFF